jgi:hypothetical protein
MKTAALSAVFSRRLKMDRVLGYIGYAVIIAFALGWMDTLSLLGIEDSRSYTWWAVIARMGGL